MLPQYATIESRRALLKELRQGNPIRATARTDSMLPAIRPGDMLTVNPSSPAELRRGDILLIQADNDWIVHRLLALRTIDNDTHAVTQGDNADRPDAAIPLDQVLGKVTEISRSGHIVPMSDTFPQMSIDDALLTASMLSSDDVALETATAFGFGWQGFLAAADREGLSPLLYYNMRKAIDSGTIPAQAAEHLSRAYLGILGRNTLFLNQLDTVASALAGNDFVVLKGAYLAAHSYPDPGLRSFSDIDILVHKSDLPRVEDALIKLGYGNRSSGSDTEQTDVCSHYLNSITYHPSEVTGPAIHVHWHLLNSIMPKYMTASMNIDSIWRGVRPVGSFFALSPEHLVIHLADHAFRHSFDSLILLRDIAEVITKFQSTINWDSLVADATSFNLTRPLYYRLLFLSRKAMCQVDSSVLEKLKPRHPGLGERIFWKLIMSGTRRPELCNMAYFSSMETLKNKSLFLRSILFPPREVLAWAYSKPYGEIALWDYGSRLLRAVMQLLRSITGGRSK